LTEKVHDAFFRALFHSPVGGIAVIDLDSLVVVDANDEMLRILGRTRDQLVNIREVGAEITPAEYEKQNAKALEQAKQRGYSDPLLKHYKRPDGTCIPVRTVFGKVPDYPERLVVFASDVTREWKQREEEAERDLRLRIALSAADQGVWDYNVETGEMIYSARAKEIYGLPADQPVTFEQIRDATHPDDLPNTHAQLLRAIDPAIRDRSSYEYRIVRPDGTICWALAYGEAIFAGEPGQERPLRYIGTILDITERKEAEEALRESEERLRLAVDSAEIGFWDVQESHGELTWPASTKAMFGISADVPVTMDDFYSGLHPDDLQPVAEAFAAAADPLRRELYDVEYRTIGKEDGVLRWVAAKGRGIFDGPEPDARCLRVIGTAIDITSRKKAEEALRESDARLRAALEASESGTFRWNLRTNELDWDEALDKLFGLPPGKSARSLDQFIALVHPDDRAGVMEHAERCATEGADFDLEFRIVVPDSATRWVYDRGKTFFGEDGEPAYMTGACVDVTERKLTEEALRDESHNLEILNRIGSAIASELDLERVVQLVTDAAVELTGAQLGAFFYNVEDEKGESYTLYTLSGVPRSAFENFPMPRNTHVFGPTFRGEGVMRSDDITKDPRYGKNPPYYGKPKGHLPVVSYLAVPVMGRSGEVIGGLFFGHAEVARFTERHERLMLGIAAQAAIAIDNARLYQAAQQANETLERRVSEALAERKLLADIVETTDALVQISDLHFNFLGINKASADEFERIFGIRPKVGDNMLELLADKPEHRAALEAVWSKALAGEEFTEIAELGDSDLDRRFYEMKYNSLRDQEGRLIGAYQFAYDVTDRLRDQQRLADTEEALRQSQKMEAVGQLVSGLAHDFNNVLGAVVAAFDMIRRRADEPARVGRFAEAGLEAAKRGAKLTSQLLAFSRKQRMELTPLFVCDVIEAVLDMLNRTLGPMVEVELGLNPAPVPVLADPTQVEMTILNLALNARDAMPEGGKLYIATKLRHITDDPELAPGEYVELTVRDTGVGMDEETLRRAIDPFFTTKPVGKGTGLGLAQVYGSARQAGGTVRIESKPGRGTTVRVFFPKTDQSVERAAKERATTDHARGSTSTVLLIDDDNDLRSVVSAALASLGYHVTEAVDGPSGLRALEDSKPDVLVVDFAMPGVNGAEVAKKARDRWPGLPVVLASGYADTMAIQDAMGEDAKLLKKPFRIDELLQAVEEAANGS
jgi:PAS domain S-box-containing protein